MDSRFQQLSNWLNDELAIELTALRPASNDASFRRYFRATTQHQTFIVMDAPPDKEPVAPFISIAGALSAQGVHTPHIHHANVQHGFLLIEDLGDRTYLSELEHDPEPLYSAAIAALIRLQRGYFEQPDLAIPDYDHDRLWAEMSVFDEWYVKRHLGLALDEPSLNVLNRTKTLLAEACLSQPQTWVHRDYHSRNLMLTERNSPGVIDFQDMVTGPIAYDLASVFKDCYIEWPRARQLQWLSLYYEIATDQLPISSFSFEQLVRWYDLAGLQRHLKVLGVFCRLHHRDGKSNYIADLPLVARHILEVLDLYPELAEFNTHFGALIRKAL